ncbi:NADH-quinone oxidoreductase subunit B family protein [Dongshaea marina]|uniref:NADH-quinone oxidoreductase subunit B family protein n=1 Tax=Dongshaea marina TaxID=2047966 RepID=UPI000D3E5DA6|nr:NADH:ubiquinone oxidoreductase [Dongshaea marina]
MSKAKVAFFDFASCEGCQIELTNLGEEVFLGLLDHLEIVEFREAMSEKTTDPIDIAFIEGSFTRESDRARLQSIRARANTVVTYGACACTGGINALKNHQSDYLINVYGKDAMSPQLDSQKALPISAAIKVDYQVHGCPVSMKEFVYIVSHLLHGKEPVILDQSVCAECKKRETVCRYTQGDHCMGMVARGGCGAPCPADGVPCEACRGLMPDANEKALVKVLQEKAGLAKEWAETKSRMYTANLRSDK